MPLFAARAAIEVMVLAVGWALGGSMGIGTVVLALGIGPLVGRCLPAAHRQGPTVHQRPSTSGP